MESKMKDYILYIDAGYASVTKYSTPIKVMVLQFDMIMTKGLSDILIAGKPELYRITGQELGSNFIRTDNDVEYTPLDFNRSDTGARFVVKDSYKMFVYDPFYYKTNILDTLLGSRIIGSVIAELSSIVPILYATEDTVDLNRYIDATEDELVSACSSILAYVDSFGSVYPDRMVIVEPAVNQLIFKVVANYREFNGGIIRTPQW